MSRTRDTERVSARYSSLKQWTPQTHDYSGQAIDLYDGAVLLVDAVHIHVGDYLLLGWRRSPVKYRVRHVEYHGGRLAYWRVRLERLSQPSAGTVDTVAS